MIFLCGCICLPSSCLTDGQSLLVVSTPQHGVNRHCISVALSVHRRPTTTSGKHAAAWCEPTLHICGIGMASTLQHGVNRHCLTKAHLRRVHAQVHEGLDNQVPRTARFCQHNCAKVVGTHCVPGPPSSFDNTAWTYIKLFHLTFLLNFFFLNFGFSIFTTAPL